MNRESRDNVDMLSGFFLEDKIKNVDLDDQDRMLFHQMILEKKTLLQDVFSQFHHQMIALDNECLGHSEGIRLEIGAGVCPMNKTAQDILVTDFVPSAGSDIVLDAQCMGIRSETVRTVYGQNCFHHFSDPRKFFNEITRVLIPGGRLILLEPYYGLLAGVLFKHMFKSEGFDKEAAEWETPIKGPMNGANQALSYIIFERDKALFHSEFPQLKIVHQHICTNGFSYLASGGLNFKQLIPHTMEKFLAKVEKAFSPLAKVIGLHHIVVLQKNS